MHGWPGDERVDRCQFSGDRSCFGETRNSAGGCLLAVTRKRRLRYQPRRAGRRIEKRQFCSLVAEQGAICEDRFCVRVPLGIRHPAWESMSAYQGSK